MILKTEELCAASVNTFCRHLAAMYLKPVWSFDSNESQLKLTADNLSHSDKDTIVCRV